MDKFEKMEADFQAEKGTGVYSKQEYAKKMHDKELAEMANSNAELPKSDWDFLAYCREYQAKLDAHEAKKQKEA